MDLYIELKEESAFDEFMKLQHEDDKKLKQMFDEMSHKDFQFSLMNLGNMLSIITTYLSFEEKSFESVFNFEKEYIRKRKVNTIMERLNQKINLRYEFDEDTKIIPAIRAYDNEMYLFIDKVLFVNLVLEKFEE